MKRFILLIAIITVGFKGFAQTPKSIQSVQKDPIICLCCGPTDPDRQPLWIVNGKILTQLNLSSLNPNYIEDMTVSKGNDAITKYGTAAKNGAVAITLKKNIKSLSINKILAKNKIDLASRKLPVYSDDKLIVGDSIFFPSDKRIKVVIVEANLSADKRMPFDGKYLAIAEIK